MFPVAMLLKILAQAFGASAGAALAEKVVDLVNRATKGDDYKKADIAEKLLLEAASGCPERIQKIADNAKRQLTDRVSDK